MATSSSYYINAPSLASATAIYTDADLTICADNGFYSDGTISREQVDCVLLPQQNCPSCALPCDESIEATGESGVFLVDINAGETLFDVGAVIVRFNPYNVPDGIKATFGSTVYNKLTSSVDGIHQSSNAGSFTYVGRLSSDCGISGTTYDEVPEFRYNGVSFIATGGTQNVTVDPGDVSLGTNAPGNTLMVIPKLTAFPSVINFEMFGPCISPAWNMSIDCPVLLTGFSSSSVGISSEVVCELPQTSIHFNASLYGTPGTVGLYDFVYNDAYGVNQLAEGFYLATTHIAGGFEWFEVDENGIVVAVGMCPVPPLVSYNCISGVCIDPEDGTGTYSSLIDCELDCAVIEYDDYVADKYRCDTCALVSSGLIVALPTGTVPVYGNYYVPSAGTGELGVYVYVLTATSAIGPGLILTTLNYATCGDACGGTPPISFNCISGNCIDPEDGTGTYESLIDCEAVCVPISYNCVGGECINPGDGTGLYPTLGDCVESCFAVSYNCVSGDCINPGDGSGTYPTLVDCEAVCTPITYAKYVAEKRSCSDCPVIIDTIIVSFDDSLPLPTLSRYYIPETGPDGFAYHVIATSTTTDPGFILTTVFGSFPSCPTSCSA